VRTRNDSQVRNAGGYGGGPSKACVWTNRAHDSVHHVEDLIRQTRAIHKASAYAQCLQVCKDLSAVSVLQRFSDKLAQAHLQVVWRYRSTGLQERRRHGFFFGIGSLTRSYVRTISLGLCGRHPSAGQVRECRWWFYVIKCTHVPVATNQV